LTGIPEELDGKNPYDNLATADFVSQAFDFPID
jgi:hypothetical protein